MKKGLLLLVSTTALCIYITKYQPQVMNKMMKPFKKMLNNMHM